MIYALRINYRLDSLWHSMEQAQLESQKKGEHSLNLPSPVDLKWGKTSIDTWLAIYDTGHKLERFDIVPYEDIKGNFAYHVTAPGVDVLRGSLKNAQNVSGLHLITSWGYSDILERWVAIDQDKILNDIKIVRIEKIEVRGVSVHASL